jgi:phosphohistidine phosphatase
LDKVQVGTPPGSARKAESGAKYTPARCPSRFFPAPCHAPVTVARLHCLLEQFCCKWTAQAACTALLVKRTLTSTIGHIDGHMACRSTWEQSMELILWRHAEAADGDPDESRQLTPRGHKQAAKMAVWLDRNLPSSCRILASPTVRTVQTAEALGRKFKINENLAQGTSPQRILKAIDWPDGREPVLVVGHQPSLGQLASLLLAGTMQNWTIRKAGAWWIVRRDEAEDGEADCYLKAAMGPDLFIR